MKGRPRVRCRTPDGREMALLDYGAEVGSVNMWRDAVMTWDSEAGLWVIHAPPTTRPERRRVATPRAYGRKRPPEA